MTRTFEAVASEQSSRRSRDAALELLKRVGESHDISVTTSFGHRLRYLEPSLTKAAHQRVSVQLGTTLKNSFPLHQSFKAPLKHRGNAVCLVCAASLRVARVRSAELVSCWE